MFTFKTQKSPRLNSHFTLLLTAFLFLAVWTSNSHAEEKLEIKQTDNPDIKPILIPSSNPNSDQNMVIRVNKNEDAPPPKVNIRFKEGYKKTDLSERTKSTYKRSLFVEISKDLSEQEQLALINERCKRYHDEQKPFYYINLLDEQSKAPIKVLSCEEAKQYEAKQ